MQEAIPASNLSPQFNLGRVLVLPLTSVDIYWPLFKFRSVRVNLFVPGLNNTGSVG